jgi:hypothetical protein
VTQRFPRCVDRPRKRSIDGLAKGLRKTIGIDEVLPRLQLVARVGDVAGNLPAKFRHLRAEKRQQDIAGDAH